MECGLPSATRELAENSRARTRSPIGAILAFVAIASLAGQRAAAEDQTPVVILISSHEAYRQAASSAAERLGEIGVASRLLVVADGENDALQRELSRLSESSPLVVVAGGAELTSSVLRSLKTAPVVSMMTPNAADADYAARGSPNNARVAIVTSDVDPARQIDWIRATQRDCKRVAVLCSARTTQTVKAIETAGRPRGVEIIALEARRDEFPAAIDALNQSGANGVLMIPDSQVYNAPNVQRLLLWGVRQKRPVWAFSPKVVKAGALAGVYADPAEVGVETARVVKLILDGASPSDVGLRYVESCDYAVNVHTAEMTDVKLESRTLDSRVVKYGDD
jgi:ABC-type uncharacterized transport system substrate-binding protein